MTRHAIRYQGACVTFLFSCLMYRKLAILYVVGPSVSWTHADGSIPSPGWRPIGWEPGWWVGGCRGSSLPLTKNKANKMSVQWIYLVLLRHNLANGVPFEECSISKKYSKTPAKLVSVAQEKLPGIMRQCDWSGCRGGAAAADNAISPPEHPKGRRYSVQRWRSCFFSHRYPPWTTHCTPFACF